MQLRFTCYVIDVPPSGPNAGLLRSVWMVIMVHKDELSAVPSELSGTLDTDLPIQGILDHLVERIVEVLPVTGAGVTLICAGKSPHSIAASDDCALRFEQLQTEMSEGPCLLAYQSGAAVAIPDLSLDDRFPRYGPAAVQAGLVAVFSFPLGFGEGRLGALELFRGTAGELAPDDMRAAQTLANVVAAYLTSAQTRADALATSVRFHHSAMHDPLTGLPNRLLLQQRLEHAAQRAQRSHANAAILFADLDRFKRINDVYGHQVGDDLLRAVAHRLSGLVRPGDTLARVSGDEFVFLCEDLRSGGDVRILAKRIDGAFATPFLLAGIELSITVSLGVAFAGPGEEISDELVVQADIAMYQAKRDGGAGYHIIDLREGLPTTDRRSLEGDLRAAFAKDELDLAYQPIVRSVDGVVTGVEALVRWTHHDRGSVPALSIIEVAERSGLISEIGSWVLERSCRDRCRWLREHPTAPLELAVNVSAQQLMDPDFCQTVASVLARTGMDSAALILEVTENILIKDGEAAMTALVDLKDLGIRLALDDFGTGYSSLSYLRRLPIHIVKIDQGFIADIDHAVSGGAIVAAVTNLAHVLDLTVIAEGVETQRQRDEVIAIGCESAQGYWYAHPMPASAISSHLGDRSAGPLRLPTSKAVVGTSI